MSTRLSPEAARMARARKDFVEAMARGCSITDLRKARAACSRQAERESPIEDAPTVQQHIEFANWNASWMLRD